VAGQPLRVICTVVVVLAYFTAQISTHASVCRLLMVMGRDDILPRAVFGYVSTRFRTPVANILIIGAIMLAAGIGLSIRTSTSFINFGAFSAFLFVTFAPRFMRADMAKGAGKELVRSSWACWVALSA